jgi:ankyrin repeat protein
MVALLKVDANPNVQDNDGRTPMHRAAEGGHTKAMAALVNVGADPNILDSEFLKPRDLLP